MAAFYRMEIKVVSRKSTRTNGSVGTNSALAAAAYISGDVLKPITGLEAAAYIAGSEMTGADEISTDYTHKKGVLYSEILLPRGSPERLKDPETLWSEVEELEGTRANAQIYREWILALPKELTKKEMMAACRDFAEVLNKQGMIVHWALHDEKGENSNFHAHFLAPTRSIIPETGDWQRKKSLPREYLLDEKGERIPLIDKKTGKQKVYSDGRKAWRKGPARYIDSFNNPGSEWVNYWRKSWETILNSYLPPDQQVCCDSYKKQGIDKIPGEHIGKSAWNVQKRIEAQIDSLSEEKRKELLEEILNEVQREYRAAYYQNQNAGAMIKKGMEQSNEAEDENPLRGKVREELTAKIQYRPARSYVSRYSRTGRERSTIEYALLKIIEFLRDCLNGRYGKEVVEVKVTEDKVRQAENDLIQTYAYGLTKVVSNRIRLQEYEMRKVMLKQLGQEIRETEVALKGAKEDLKDGEYLNESAKLDEFRSRIQQLRAFQIGGGARPSHPGVAGKNLDAAENVAAVAAELQASAERLGRASTEIAENESLTAKRRKPLKCD
ncbi:MAG: MobA/MobL family protein [Lachnospiraceae bacterium]|nr:MobA/MobL family protein [Lachnospiraceae bacterium]